MTETFTFNLFNVVKGLNIGDDIQTIALLQGIHQAAKQCPFATFYDISNIPNFDMLSEELIEECFSSSSSTVSPENNQSLIIKPLVFNRDDFGHTENVSQLSRSVVYGWHCHAGENRQINVPSRNVPHPIYISFHTNKDLQRKIVRDGSKDINHFKEFSPIACRDTETLKFFTELGIPAKLTMCLTLSLNIKVPKTANIFYVDTPIPQHMLDDPNVHFITHQFKNLNFAQRLNRAHELLKLYAGAARVVTSRIHCALPCIAFGTPVTFVSKNGVPYNSKTKSDRSSFFDPSRLDGITALFDEQNRQVDSDKILRVCSSIKNMITMGFKNDMNSVYSGNSVENHHWSVLIDETSKQIYDALSVKTSTGEKQRIF